MAGEFDDLIPQNNGNQNQVLSSPQQATVPTGFEDLIPQQKKQGTFMDMVDSFNATVNKFAAGELQLFAKGLDALGVNTKGFQRGLAENTAQYQQAGAQARINSPKATMVSDLAGDVANVVNVGAQGGGAGLAKAAPTVLGRVGQSAALSGAEGMLEYGDANERGQRGALGAALGAAGQGVGETIGMLAKNAVSPLFKGGVDQAAQKIDEGAKLTLGQATGRPGIQKVESTLADVPVLGTKSNIVDAADSVTAQVQDTLGDLGVNKQKAAVLAEDLKTSLNTAKSNAISKTNAAYDDVIKTAEEKGIAVPLTNTNKLAKEILDTATGRAERGLKSAEISLNSDAGKVLEDLANNQSIKGGDFDFLRKNLKGVIDDAYKTGGNSKLIEPLKQLRGAMDSDLNLLAEAGDPVLKDKLMAARATHKILKEPFNQDPFLKKLKAGEYVDPDKLLNAAVKNDSPYATSMIMKVLPKESQDTFSTALIQKTVKKATTDGELNLQALGKNLGKLGETLDAIPGDAADKVKGIQKLISESDYILEAAKPKSKLNMPSGIAGSALGAAAYTAGAPAAIGVGLLMKGISSTLTNPAMVKQIVRLGGGKLNKQTTKETINHIITRGIIPAIASGQAEDEEEAQ